MLHKGVLLTLLSIVASAAVLSSAEAQQGTLSQLPTYQPAKLEANTLTSVGSDSMGELLGLWVKKYGELQPTVTVQVTSHGSASAPPALVDGFADIGPMAREMKEKELLDFQRAYGFEPTQIRTALSGIAVYASTSNPLDSISFADLDRIFSAEPSRNENPRAANWSELGVEGSFAKEPIMALMRGPATFPHAFFRQRVLLQEDFSPYAMPIAGMPALLEIVASNSGAIGFGEIVAPIKGTKILKVRRGKGNKAYAPTEPALIAGQYPLTRFLNIYVVRFPGKDIDPAAKDFLNFVLSQDGQSVAEAAGLLPLPAEILLAERAKLN
jgi:phosphate transport system substrate-binding protein